MAIELFKLVGTIMVDNDKANKSISKTEDKAKGLGDKLKGGIKTAAKFGAGLAAGAGAAVVGMTKLAKETGENADEIDKMSQRLGMSSKAYQEWGYVLSQSGVDINSMQTGMKTLTNQIGEAQKGSKDATARFKELGISQKDLATLSREDIFAKVVTGMQGMEDSTNRAAIANKMFGKSGQNLTPLFNESAKSTENLKKQANELGMVMSDSTIKSGVELNDTIDTMKKSFEGAKNSLGSALIPILNDFFKLIIDITPTIRKIFDTLTPVLKKVFSALLPPLIELVNQILPLVAPLLEAIMPLLNIAIKVITKMIPLISTGLTLAIKGLTPVISGLAKIFETVFGSIIGYIKPPINAIIDAINSVIKSINKLKIPDWVPGVGGKSLDMPTFKKLNVGINYVPENDYPAILHEGEAVLTKQQAYLWRKGGVQNNDDVIRAIENLMNMLPSLIEKGNNGLTWNINQREFARMVKKNA